MKKGIFLRSKTTIYLSLGLHKGRPSYKRTLLKREHPAFQNMIFLKFFFVCGSFLPSWIRIQIPNTDPDPKPCLFGTIVGTDPKKGGQVKFVKLIPLHHLN